MSIPPNVEDDKVYIMAPDYRLKKKLGDEIDIQEILSPENVTRAQGVINSRQRNFLEWVEKDMATIESSLRHIQKNITKSIPYFTKLKRAVFAVKAQAGTFGFDLASEVSRSLFNYCETSFRFEDKQVIVLAKHVEALSTVVKQRISGDGGEMGRKLLEGLNILVVKFK